MPGNLLEFKLQLVSGTLKRELPRESDSRLSTTALIVADFDILLFADDFGELPLAEVVRCPPIF
jgi:hypothetical protein